MSLSFPRVRLACLGASWLAQLGNVSTDGHSDGQIEDELLRLLFPEATGFFKLLAIRGVSLLRVAGSSQEAF